LFGAEITDPALRRCESAHGWKAGVQIGAQENHPFRAKRLMVALDTTPSINV